MSFIKNLFRKTVIVVLMTLIAGAFSLSPVSFNVPATFVEAAINPEINYQGKLEDSSGNAVSDTTYSIEFNLYTAPTGGSSIWTETNNATTTDGLFSVLLGTNTSLSTVNFNQTLYLGVNVEADGEMSPRKKLGTVPAAFESDRLDGLDSDDFLRATTSDNFESGTLTFDSGTTLDVNGSALFEVSTTTSATSTNLYSSILGVNNEYFTDLTGTGLTNSSGALAIDESGLTVENLGTSLTTGSVVFSNGSSLAQDNSNFFWDDSNNRLGIGTNSPTYDLEVAGDVGVDEYIYHNDDTDTSIRLQENTTTLAAGGANLVLNTSSLSTSLNTIRLGSSVNTLVRNGGTGALTISTNANGDIDFDPGGTGNVIVTSGNLGIGTSSPFAKLSVVGDLALPTGGIYDNNDSLGTNGYVLQSDGSGINWVATSSLGISGGGGESVSIGDAIGSGTTGSVLYIDSSGNLAQDNSGFYFDDSNNALGIGTTTTGNALTVVSPNSSIRNGVLFDIDAQMPDFAFRIRSDRTPSSALDSETLFNVGVGTDSGLTGNGRVGIGTTTTDNLLTIVGSNGTDNGILLDGDISSEFLLRLRSQANPINSTDSDTAFNVSSVASDSGGGRVGIGTTTTDNLLTIVSNNTSDNGFLLDGDTGSDFLFRLRADSSPATSIDDSDTAFNVSSIAGGIGTARVGIGTTTTDNLLTIVSNNSPAGGILLDTDTASPFSFRIRSDTNPLNILDSDTLFDVGILSSVGGLGNAAIGIGTTTDSNRIMSIVGPNSASSQGILFDYDSTAPYFLKLRSDTIPGTGSNITDDDTKFIITGDGNVGIGTSSPYAKLSVVGETVSEYFTSTSTTATSTFAAGVDISGDLAVRNPLYPSNSVQIENTQSNTGRIGYGTATNIGLDSAIVTRIKGNETELFTGNFDTYLNNFGLKFGITCFFCSDAFEFTHDSNLLMTVQSGGNVGIGTSTPFANLSVVGDLALPTGGIYDNNDSLGTDGYVLQSDGSGINWVATSSLGISGGGGGGGATFGQALELINSTTLAPTTTDAGIGIQADFFNATSTTATSTFQGNLHVYDTLQVGTSSVYITTDLINYDRQIRIGSASTTPEVIIGNVSGNKRGDEAIDLQTSRASVADVASGQSAIAIGGDSTASGLRSISIGWASDATQSYATAIGYSNTASQSFSSAVGYDNTASGSQSVSFGYSNSVTSSSASAVGLSNTVSSSNASAFGYSNSVTDEQSSAFGYQNTIEQGFTGGTALGNSNDVRESYASAVGYSNSADAEESSAFGSRNTASGSYASAFGYNNTASGGNSTAVGYSNNAAGSNSAVFGTSNQINSSASFASAFGYSNLINSSALKSTAIGFDNTINSSVRNAGAFGWQVTVGANGASAFGSSITNNVASSTMIGPNTDSALILLSNGKAALGTTTPDDTDNLAETLFEVEDHEGDVRFVLDRKDGSGQFSELLFQEGNANKFGLGHDNSNLYFYNYENSEYAMVIEESSSEVGIGTQTPQRTLHVSVGSDTPPVRFEDTNGYCEINPTSATWNCTSDQTLKENINSLSSSEELEKLRQLRPVEFEWKSDESNKKVTGLIAQEVEEVLPELVITDKESGLKSVGYGGLITYLLSAVQELADKVEQLAVRGYAAAVGAFQQLIVGSPSEPGGIQMYDEETGDPYCITIRGGSIITRSGTCDIDPEDVLFEKEIHVLEDETEQTGSEENSETGNENSEDIVEDTSTSTPETIEEEEETTNEENTETSSSTPEIIEEENSETEETVPEITDTDTEETPTEENVITEEETVETQTESEPEEEVVTEENSETEEVTPETSE